MTDHSLYLNARLRDHAVVRLNFESLKAFCDTVIVGQRHQLALERLADKVWDDSGGWDAGLDLPPAHSTWNMLEYLNFEYLKIASAFEIHLKARLLSTDHVLHMIDRSSPIHKALAEEQRERPILKAEILSLSEFHFDGTKNYLPGLKKRINKILMAYRFAEVPSRTKPFPPSARHSARLPPASE